MPVCITGMHRSGTSLVANLLHLCGLYLGNEADLVPPTPDNSGGHWENSRFKEINEQILKEQHATWYSPPWMDHHRVTQPIAEISRRAKVLVNDFSGHEPWGWKDPRNCLTLPMWAELLPGMNVVICLRNPVEVANSLRRRPVFKYSPGNTLWRTYKEIRSSLSIQRRRSFSQQACLQLWQTYNVRIMQHAYSERRIVTHYESYFRDPLAELRRLLHFLNMDAPENALKEAAAVSSDRFRHNWSTTQDLLQAGASEEIRDLYLGMCEEAGYLSHQPECALNTSHP